LHGLGILPALFFGLLAPVGLRDLALNLALRLDGSLG
jgi:hypothetical protein